MLSGVDFFSWTLSIKVVDFSKHKNHTGSETVSVYTLTHSVDNDEQIAGNGVYCFQKSTTYTLRVQLKKSTPLSTVRNFLYSRGLLLLRCFFRRNTVLRVKWNPTVPWLLLSGGRDCAVRLTDLRRMAEPMCFEGHRKEVTALDWSAAPPPHPHPSHITPSLSTTSLQHVQRSVCASEEVDGWVCRCGLI